ncbi:SCO family protein [Sphingorhabdus soli]|uniref:SCO family protein n=1 Tax=Flavisphingopyxis soli TaxID=2601267 RepID=A0A5C6UK62_9SPHN|nr:SCO family protein [Sphingorhabdus soli]TXC73422.1 SCO family protein [Sphingorhabdus soli]
MADSIMNIASSITLALALASLSACSPSPSNTAEPPLAGASIGGPFSLVDQDGAVFTDRDLNGKYAIVYFGYTYCPDVCPVDLQKLMRGLAAFEKSDPAAAALVQPVFISVDPARDTPPVLKTFVRSFGPRLIGLTGTDEQVAAAAKAYAASYHKVAGSQPDAYLMAHTQIAYLMGPNGEPIALLPLDDPSTSQDEASPAAIAATLAQWVRPAR